ncbi:MAG TPA: polysaccharide deacetylase family protein [Candidatus Saccharimonadales bacterium]|nr:polysaccharide deacetylase family protein [Candidatus Saccharimonadales bacterium]
MKVKQSIFKSLSQIKNRGLSLLLAGTLCSAMVFSAVPKASAALTPAARVSFTFDDAQTSALTQAAPTLAKYGFAGTEFVPTGCVGSVNTCPAEPTHSYMTWAQVSQLKSSYGWEVTSHTVTHPLLASSDPTSQPNVLTPSQVIQELSQSKADLAAHGFTSTDFATPYGDWTPPVLAQIAQYYSSHRGFADTIDQDANGTIDHGNTFPYNDYLIYDYPVQAGVTVAQVKAMIDQTKASNQWLVLTFHDIQPVASTNPDDYQYNTSDLDQIAAYVKSLSIPVVTMANGLVTNAGNLLPNSSFDTAISSTITNTSVWSTDAPANIKQDTGTHGNFPSPANSVSLTGTTKNVELFSPQVPVSSAKTYVLKNYLNLTNITVAAGSEVDFYIDEYNAGGTWLQTQFKKSEVGNAANATGAWVEDLNFEYKPTNANVTKARLQVVVTANSAVQAYLDNVQWFAEDGSTTGGVGAGAVGGKIGDLNGNGHVDITDLSILLSHWGQSGAVGNLDANPIVNINDLSILLAHWG